jgi:hypothetical protein
MKFELEDFHRDISDEELLTDMKRVAAKLNQNFVTVRQQNEHGKYHPTTIINRFGGWLKAVERAGLGRSKQQTDKWISEESLFENLEEVWTKLGRQPKHRDMKSGASKYGPDPYARIFGSWRAALERFVASLEGVESISSERAIQDLRVEPFTRHKTQRNINWRLRFIVLRRDSFKCKGCGRSPATDPTIILHVDHIKAWANGGETVLQNLQTLCSVCNIGKSDL